MGLFSGPNPFDPIVEKVTDAKNTSEDWGMIMDLCDQVQTHRNGAKDCLKAVIKRLNNPDPHVILQAITVLDACVNNCGKEFRLEVASREFETEFRRLLSRTQPKVQEKLRGLLKTWAEGEFKTDSQLSLIPSLYNALKREGMDFSSASDQPKKVIPKDPNVVSSQQEEDDIAKAIQLSLQETKAKTASSALYPTASSLVSTQSASSPVKKNEKKARALYDFEAVEDNELTFKTGEIVIIIDDSDANWWKGSNHRGEGLFPANFVTTDLSSASEPEPKRSVQFNEEVEVQEQEEVVCNEISEERIDHVLRLLHEADPSAPDSDPVELPGLEDQVNQMGPLIDAELESVDRRHAQLTRLSSELVEALNLYHQLMLENSGYAMMGGGQPTSGYYMGPPIPPPPQQQQQFNGYYQQPQPMMGYPGMPVQGDNQAYIGSAPPPPTPPLNDPNNVRQTQHFITPQPPSFNMNNGQPGGVPSGGYIPTSMPQM